MASSKITVAFFFFSLTFGWTLHLAAQDPELPFLGYKGKVKQLEIRSYEMVLQANNTYKKVQDKDRHITCFDREGHWECGYRIGKDSQKIYTGGAAYDCNGNLIYKCYLGSSGGREFFLKEFYVYDSLNRKIRFDYVQDTLWARSSRYEYLIAENKIIQTDSSLFNGKPEVVRLTKIFDKKNFLITEIDESASRYRRTEYTNNLAGLPIRKIIYKLDSSIEASVWQKYNKKGVSIEYKSSGSDTTQVYLEEFSRIYFLNHDTNITVYETHTPSADRVHYHIINKLKRTSVTKQYDGGKLVLWVENKMDAAGNTTEDKHRNSETDQPVIRSFYCKYDKTGNLILREAKYNAEPWWKKEYIFEYY